MDFASRYYAGLGGGIGLEQAYNEAVAAIKTKKGSDTRVLYLGNATATEALVGHQPWELPGSSPVPSRRAAGICRMRWAIRCSACPTCREPGSAPESRFRHLNWFTREHAEVFFGRGFQVRELFQAVTTDGAPPIVLFYGQSGVGKSSVLDAGLLPPARDDLPRPLLAPRPDAGPAGDAADGLRRR